MSREANPIINNQPHTTKHQVTEKSPMKSNSILEISAIQHDNLQSKHQAKLQRLHSALPNPRTIRSKITRLNTEKI